MAIIKHIAKITRRGYPGFIAILVYFILHNSNEYFGLLSTAVIIKYFLVYLATGFICFILFFFLFKDRLKSGLYAALLMIVFLFFGASQDFVQSNSLLSWLGTYKISLGLIACLLIFSFLFIKKMSHDSAGKWNTYLFTVSMVLCFWEAAITLHRIAVGPERLNDLGDPGKNLSTRYTPCDTCRKPDIFFIVWDMFTSSDCLRREFGYDNSGMDSFLLRKGFYIADQSRSNYAFTFFALPSIFNLDYLNEKKIGPALTAKFQLRGLASTRTSELMTIFRKQGYTVHNISGFEIDGIAPAGNPFFPDKTRKVIYDQTLAGRIQKDILWNFMPASDKDAAGSFSQKRKQYIDDFINAYKDSMYAILNRQNSMPDFVYLHMMIPHPPYFFRQDGGLNDEQLVENDLPHAKDLYLGQLIYSSKILQQVIDSIMTATHGNCVIITAGDHGFRDYASPEKKERMFDILNAFYFPDKDYRLLYPSISPVNTFRVILNKFFQQKYPLLRDTSYYINDPKFYFEQPAGAK